MLNIRDQIFVTVKIDGQELQSINISGITLCEGNGAYAPTIKLELTDPTSSLSKRRALSEGNPIEIMIARSQKDSKVKIRKYRIYGPARENPTNNPNLEVVGFLDSPKYFTKSARESFTSCSSATLESIAEMCDLKYVGPDEGRKTSDSQTRLNVCATRARFVHDVTRHAYMDKTSCMASAVTSYKELRFKNIIDTINTPIDKIKFVFMHNNLESSSDGSKKRYLVKETRDKSTAGVMSNWLNYGNTRCHNDIEGVQKNIESCSIKIPGAYLAINKDVASEVKRARFDYERIDCTNNHPRYETAYNQNIKILSVFSESVALLVDVVTDVELFDPIVYRQADADPKSKVRNEDVYIVVGKTIVIRGGVHYAERIQCARPSITMKGNCNLKNVMEDGGSEGGEYVDAESVSQLDSNPVSTALNCVGQFGGTQSIITSANIDRSASNKGIDNVPVVSDIISQLSSIYLSKESASMNVQSLLPKTADSVSGIISVLGSILGAQPSSTIQANMVSSVMSLTSMIPDLNSLNSNADMSQTTLTELLATLSGLPMPVLNAALTKKDGPVDAMAESVKALAVFGSVGKASENAIASVPRAENSGTVDSWRSATSTVNSQVYSTAASTAASWNKILSATSGKPIPENPQSTSDFMQRLMVLLSKPDYKESEVNALVTSELLKASSNPTWMTADSFMPAATVPDTATLTRMITNL